MKPVRRIAGVILLASLLVGLPFVQAAAQEAPRSQFTSTHTALSSIWDTRISRWAGLILQEAARRKLDPDLLAALIWRESRGDPSAIGPGGSVGLMQIMPKEAGFSWRPSRNELLVPSTNVGWGTATLAQIIMQARGDVSSALAAYNGGWEKANDPRPRAFAGTILRDYARAVAHRQGIEGHWVAFFAIVDEDVRGPIWVADSARDDLYFYGDANVTPAGARMIPLSAPVAILAECTSEPSGTPLTAGLWIYRVDAGEWVSGDTAMVLAPAGASPGRGVEPQRPRVVSPALMAGSVRPAAVPALSRVTAPPAMPAAPATPVPTPATSETPTRPCDHEPLVVEAYPLERINTVQGWVVSIYASASGGNCAYTYAWNDAATVKGQDMPGPIVFEIHSVGRDSVLLGTVVVTSGQETARVRLYIRPPD
jgi:hypothetical protein